jgi:hypothetical protein
MTSIEHVITRHAKKRMRERKITLNKLKSTIEDPDYIDKGERGEFKAVRTFWPEEIIKVIYVEEKGKKIIITAIRYEKR